MISRAPALETQLWLQPFFALLVVMLSSFTLSSEVRAAEPKGPLNPKSSAVSYFHDILPIFRANCHGCHQPAAPKGEFVMTARVGLLKGGASEEAAVVPGHPEKSNLITLITPDGEEAEMPKGKPVLTEKQRQLIADWITAGAKDDTPKSILKIDADHPPIYHLPPVITSLDYSPDGSLLAVSGYHEVLLHKADGSGLVARLVGLSERIESISFSPNGKQILVAGGQPGRLGEIQIWDVATKKISLSITVTFDTVYGASWSPNGKLVSCGCSDNTVRAFDVESGKQVLFNGAHSDWVLDTVFSTKSDYLITVSRDRSMKLIQVGTQRFIDNITSITPGALKGGLAVVDRHPSKDELLIAGSDGVPKIYKMVRTQARKIGDDHNLLRKFEGHPGRLCAAEYSADGNRIVVGSSFNRAGRVSVFDANNSKKIADCESPGGGVYAAAFSPDGKVVACGGFDGYVRLYASDTGKLIKRFVPVKIAQKAAAEKITTETTK